MVPNVFASKLPLESILNARVTSSDFLDCYAIQSSLAPRRAAEIITDFPNWARFLLRVRKVVTAPFGLSNDGPVADDKLGPFPVESETEKELVVGFNDKHLDFRVSIMSEGGKVFLATWVHPHNIGGHFYLSCIFPFHVMIARDALKRVVKNKTFFP